MSYSTTAKFAARIGPRIYAGLTGEDGVTPSDSVAQGMLDAAARRVNSKIGTIYAAPVRVPDGETDSDLAMSVGILASYEEEIALWFLYVRRGIGEQETAAAAAKVGYDSAMADLLLYAKNVLVLTGVPLRNSDTDPGGGFVMSGEKSHFDPPASDLIGAQPENWDPLRGLW